MRFSILNLVSLLQQFTNSIEGFDYGIKMKTIIICVNISSTPLSPSVNQLVGPSTIVSYVLVSLDHYRKRQHEWLSYGGVTSLGNRPMDSV